MGVTIFIVSKKKLGEALGISGRIENVFLTTDDIMQDSVSIVASGEGYPEHPEGAVIQRVLLSKEGR